ncbi:arginine--tRNA ligase [candidate division KSB1 bacterium]|nr:arginine--tRNA ligase [candidate division KSB1 bacterium]
MNETISVTQEIENVIRLTIKSLFSVDYQEPVKLDAPPDEKMGDFAFACFPLAKILRLAPPVIAQKLKDGINLSGIIENVIATGPYLNIFVNYAELAEILCTQILAKPDSFGNQTTGQGEKILIEYSAPNTNKPQHLGHVRNDLLGMAIGNLLKTVGYNVSLVNLVNDRGVHICKSMLAYQKFGNGTTPESEGVKGDHFVGHFYVLYDKAQKKEWDEWIQKKNIVPDQLDPQEKRKIEAQFLQESHWYQQVQTMLQKWEAGDPEITTLWEKMNNWVYQGFDQTYQRLGCHFDKVYKESQTYMLGKALVDEGLKKGLFYQKEDNSIWVDLTDVGLDQKLLIRRDGTSVYITQDLGTTKLKYDDFQLKRAIWIVADEQIYHFQVLFATMKKLGFEWADNCFHLAYGMIDLPEGKMKSREGTVVDADDLMNELFEMESAEIKERNVDIPAEDFNQTAEILALGALKFFILKFTPLTRMTFNPKESISPLGFTGPYIQYAYVRVKSIFRNSELYDFEQLNTEKIDFSILKNPEEKAIIRKLNDFPQELLLAAQTYNPARLCTYLFELAKTLNSFYHDHSVLKAETEELVRARLVLSKATALVLKRGLQILGIAVPERM